MSFEQLLDIYRQDAAERAAWAAQPPQSCPNDGTPLEGGPGGVLFCRHDGWTYPRDWTAPGTS